MMREEAIDFDDASFYAARMLHRAGMAGVDAPDALEAAWRLGLDVRYVRRTTIDCPGELGFARNGQPVVRLWSDLPQQYLQFQAARVLGFYCLHAENLVRINERAWGGRFAAGFLAPHRSVWTAWIQTRGDLSELYRRFPQIPAEVLSLRLEQAQIGSTFMFDVLPHCMRTVIAREELLSPAVYGMALRAHLEGKSSRPGLRAARLPNFSGRVAVILSDAA